jgi:hypothetical protein
LAAVVAAAQNDQDVEQAFLAHWIKPRRALSLQALERFQRDGQLPANWDIEQVLDAMYGPFYFLLMVRHAAPTPEYVAHLADMLLQGLLPR